MGAFNTSKFVPTTLQDFGTVVQRAEEYFTADGYSFVDNSGALGAGFSISKGGIFKAVLGMKTALNVEITPITGGVNVSASVGIFGEQVIPTVISMFFLWPVLITQITGLVQQSKLDETVIGFVENTIHQLDGTAGQGAAKDAGAADGLFCTACGQRLPAGSRFCSACGARLEQ